MDYIIPLAIFAVFIIIIFYFVLNKYVHKMDDRLNSVEKLAKDAKNKYELAYAWVELIMVYNDFWYKIHSNRITKIKIILEIKRELLYEKSEG